MFIKRNFDRTEDDDWILNVQPRLNEFSESVPQYDTSGNIVGWKIQKKFD